MSRFIRRSTRTVYENRWLRFEAHEIVHPNGRPGEHGVVVTPRSCAVVVLDGDDVLLVRQARFAVDAEVLEVVKGGAADGESDLACAQRETREETGFLARRWDALGRTYEIPSIVAEPVSIFLARELEACGSELEDVESIDVVRMPFAAAFAAVTEGELDDAVSAIALLRAARRIELMR